MNRIKNTHILLFIPKDHIDRVEIAFKRLFIQVGNKFEKNILSASSYIMKYINKTLPMSKGQISESEQYINAWYIKHRVNRFCSSRSTAPMYLYRLLHKRFTLFGLTQVHKGDSLRFGVSIDDEKKIMRIWDDHELIYSSHDNISVKTIRGLAA